MYELAQGLHLASSFEASKIWDTHFYFSKFYKIYLLWPTLARKVNFLKNRLCVKLTNNRILFFFKTCAVFFSLDAFVEKIMSIGHRDGGFSLLNEWLFSWLLAEKKGTTLGNILYSQE